MIRFITGFIVFAALLLAAAWLAERPGEVSVDWLGYRIETSVGLLAAALIVAGLAVAALYLMWRGIVGAPGAWFGRRSESRRRRGYRALSLGMVAVAAGDVDEANRQAKRAENLLEDPPITMLLSAQAAQLGGDTQAARRYFTTMLENPETAFLGLRGLLMQALRENNAGEALQLAERAYSLKPTTPWVVQSLFDMQARAGQWDRAQQTLQGGLRNRVVPVERGQTLKAILLVERSRDAEAKGNMGDASAFAREAFAVQMGRIPVAARHAERLIADGDMKRARKILLRAWAVCPHPDLAQLYLAAEGSADPLKRVQALQVLTGANPDDIESHIVLAREALEARLWGEARRHLTAAAGDNPPARVCALLADLEESESADGERVRRWLTRATVAPIDRHWRCQPCGMVVERWQSICPHCSAFGTIDWRSPPPGYMAALSDASEPLPEIATPAIAAPGTNFTATGTTVAPVTTSGTTLTTAGSTPREPLVPPGRIDPLA
jgi:HemY protein